MSVETKRNPLWDAELERLGRDSVIARLTLGREVGSGPASEFKLWMQQVPNPTRSYVEDWIARREAEAKTTDTKRFRAILVVTVAGAIAGIAAAIASLIAAWPVVWSWFKSG